MSRDSTAVGAEARAVENGMGFRLGRVAGLLMVSCQVADADSLSTMTMGVAHCGQRKQAGCVGAELVAGA